MTAFRIPRPKFNFFHPKSLLLLLWLFLLVFPKGGIKIADVPLTWGYLFLGITSLFICLQGSWTVSMSRIAALLCLIPFQIIATLSMMWNGFGGFFGWVLSFWISFLFLPFVFLFLLSSQIEKMDLSYFLELFKKGVLFVSWYGIFLFIYKQTTGKFLEIPFLIVNTGDLGTLDDGKCNGRGIVSKLISTYNNGQLFGISMIMLLTLYCHIQKNPWHRFATKLALLLTLSRTTWIGLFLHEILYSVFVLQKTGKLIIYSIFGFIILVFGLFTLLNYYDVNVSVFLFDTGFGGRRGQLEEALQDCSLFPNKPFMGISEMTYMSLLNTFGVVGLLAYALAMAGPLVFHFARHPSKIRTCVFIGMINYLVISFSDGATLYIPVLAFYWFLMSLLMRKDLDPIASRSA